jgi:hypothetical protein
VLIPIPAFYKGKLALIVNSLIIIACALIYLLWNAGILSSKSPAVIIVEEIIEHETGLQAGSILGIDKSPPPSPH